MLVYGEQFAHRLDIFVWVMVTGLVLYATTPFGYGLTAMQIFHVQPVVFAAVLANNVASCLLLVRSYGALGVVWGWLIAAFCQLLLIASLNGYRLRAARRTALLRAG